MFHIFVLVGESGSGKTTIQNELEKRKLNAIKGSTTRAMRNGESQGKPYNFTTVQAFKELLEKGEVVEHVILYDDYYFMTKNEVKNNKLNIAVLDPNGLRQFKELYGDENVTGIYLYAPKRERIKRMASRGDSVNKVKDRLIYDKEAFRDAYMSCEYKVDSTTQAEDLTEVLNIIQEVLEEKELR